MELLRQIVDIFLHLDVHLNELAIQLGPWLYLLVFAVIFCETGLVVMPILPGDSLLFALGALASIDGSPINVHLLMLLLLVAAITGDALNYTIGHKVGPRIFAKETGWLLNKNHLEKTNRFYAKHGGKTIIFARFIPIIRTFAPFVAGIGRMGYSRFASFNVIGALCWVPPFLYAGYFMGNIPAVKQNFHIIIVAIIILSVLPAVIEWLRSRKSTEH